MFRKLFKKEDNKQLVAILAQLEKLTSDSLYLKATQKQIDENICAIRVKIEKYLEENK